MSQFRENLPTDERTDGEILFYMTFPAEAGGPIMIPEPINIINVGVI